MHTGDRMPRSTQHPPTPLKTLVHALGCGRIRGNGEVIQREEFEQRKEAAEQARQARLNKKPKKLASQGKNVEDYPLLQVCAGAISGGGGGSGARRRALNAQPHACVRRRR